MRQGQPPDKIDSEIIIIFKIIPYILHAPKTQHYDKGL